MKIPGMRLIKKAERKGNEVEVPVAKNLGLVDIFKLTYKEMNEVHVMAFLATLPTRAFSRSSHFSPSCSRSLGSSTRPTSSTPWSTSSPA
jgi:hypothetical protein